MRSLLPGEFAYVFLVSILDAALISWVALRWYRRSVRNLMSEKMTGATSTTATGTVATPRNEAASTPLTIALFEAARDDARTADPNPARAARGRLFAAYAFGAALYAAVLTAFFLHFDVSLPPATWFGQWWVFLWPLLPALALLLVLTRREVIRLAAAYVVTGAVALALLTLIVQIVRGSVNTAPLTNVFWYLVALIVTIPVPLALVLVTGWRRVRAVTPLALTSALIFGFALLLFRQALAVAFNVGRVRSAMLTLAVHTSDTVMYYGTFMLVALPAGWLAWRLLQTLGARFDAKRFSDVQLIVDCWWLIVTAEATAVHLATDYGLAGIAVGAGAFCVYRTGVWLALRRPSPLEPAGKRLLLLRVFGYQQRTEALFDRIAQQWRFKGPVQLIAGVDLAMRTVDPADVLAFVSGRLDERYIASPDDVDPRVASLDVSRDPDGRFRINELYCRDHTWTQAFRALVAASDVVLMDLRNFSAINSGCQYELEQLVERLTPQEIVLVYDDTTDLALLSRFLLDGWRRTSPDASRTDAGSVACVRVQSNSTSEFQLLMRRLLEIEPGGRVLPVTELAAARV